MMLMAGALCAQDAPMSTKGYMGPTKDSDAKAIENRVNAVNDLGYLTFKSADGNYMWFQDYRIVVDGDEYFQDKNKVTHANGFDIDEVRIGQSIVYNRDWIGTFEIEFDMGQTFSIKDATIGSMHFDNTLLRIGQNKVAWGMDELLSDRFLNFIERAAVIDCWKPGRQMGATINKWGDNWQYEAGFYTQQAKVVDGNGVPEASTYGGRFSFAPVLNDRNLIHFGVAGYWSQPKAANSTVRGTNDTYSFSEGDETSVDAEDVVATPKITYTSYDNCWDGEFAFRAGRLYGQAEYSQNKVHRKDNLGNPVFDGAYAWVGFFLTDYSRPYEASLGNWGRVVPTHKGGEWELALRYSMLNLNDPRVLLNPATPPTNANLICGGKEDILTLGLNWYANYNSKIMFNLQKVTTDAYAGLHNTYGLPGSDSYMVAQLSVCCFF
jgi:phosphate-selective porin OprO/OprP